MKKIKVCGTLMTCILTYFTADAHTCYQETHQKESNSNNYQYHPPRQVITRPFRIRQGDGNRNMFCKRIFFNTIMLTTDQSLNVP